MMVFLRYHEYVLFLVLKFYAFFSFLYCLILHTLMCKHCRIKIVLA